MKRKSFLLIFVIIPIILNICAAGPSASVAESMITELSSTTIVGVDPSNIADDTLQAGSSSTVNLTVTDVTNLGTWQANMSWDPDILNWTNGWKGDFLAGNPAAEWHGRPYDAETTPFNQITKNPMFYDPMSGNWTNPMGACGLGGAEASCATDGVTETYYTYNIPAFTSVSRVEVGLKSWTPELNTTFQDKIEFQATNNGGTTWGPVHTINVYPSSILWWEDVTSDFAWTPDMLSNANFKVKIKYKQIGATANVTYLDWIPVRVTDTLNVENPVRAYDNNINSYASLAYSQRTGSFTVLDFGYNYPGGVDDPAEELSNITQVDFHMKFGANASDSSDQYRIVYDAPVVSSEVVELVPWTSSATPLGTYSWLNQSDPNDDPFDPFTWGWEWDCVSQIRFRVETNKVGGDLNAMFYEYEAWVTVTYLRPTSSAFSLNQDAGWTVFSEVTTGGYAGVSGSGWLGTFNFTVIGYGSTVLNITHSLTKLLDQGTPPQLIAHTTVDGYFSNKILGDVNGDGIVDGADFSLMGGAYRAEPGDPNWLDDADINRDGIVDGADFSIAGGNYRKEI